MKRFLVLGLAMLLFSATGITAFALPIETYRGSVTAAAPAVVPFSTGPTDTGVILTYKSRNGGDRTLEVFDSGGTLVATISIPGEVTSGWSTFISVSPSSAYTVKISISEGRTKYTLYVNHCPDGNCF